MRRLTAAAQQLMQARALRRAPLCAAIVIGAVGIADITRLGLTTYRFHLAQGSTPVVMLAAQRPSGNSIARIITGHLFGDPPTPAVQGDLREAPDVGGAFMLSGVIASRDPKAGYAILGRMGQPTRLYHAGGLLVGLGSGRLYEVYEDRVILDLDGRFEILRLPHPGSESGHVLVSAWQAANINSVRSDQPIYTAKQDTGAAPLSPARMFKNLNPVPRFAAGHFGGLRLMPSPDDEEKFGVRNGDLVVAVNGVPLTNASAVNGLLTSQANTHATVTLTVLRDGTQQVIQVTNGN
ncbi:MAG TPA: type II secretion system protein N [Steroidobacteraceae bacterium]|nr:type II secretion system protein N [Steroidobacteraceae bacterium]